MYTIKDIRELDPCEEYTEERLEELWKGKESLALREILELNIPIVDRNWVGSRLVSIEIVVKWAHLCAHEAEKHAGANAAAATASNAASNAAARSAGYVAEYAGYAARSAAGYAADAAADADADDDDNNEKKTTHKEKE